MKTKEEIAQDLGISRKTLYNYLNELKIKEITPDTLNTLKEYSKSKNKSKETTKSELLEELNQLKLRNAELQKQNETLQQHEEVLLNQIEYFRNDINSEIKQIKQNITLLLNPPKEEKKSIFKRFFGN